MKLLDLAHGETLCALRQSRSTDDGVSMFLIQDVHVGGYNGLGTCPEFL